MRKEWTEVSERNELSTRKKRTERAKEPKRQTRPLHGHPDPIAAALITSKQRVKTTLTKTLYIYQQKKKGRQRADLLHRPRQTRVERTPDGSRGRICPHGGREPWSEAGVAFWRDIRLAGAFNLKKFWASAFFP